MEHWLALLGDVKQSCLSNVWQNVLDGIKLRLLINSIFGALYSFFWDGDSFFFQKISSDLHSGLPTFSKICLWDSCFQKPSENPETAPSGAN